jgi:hypothetical protein
MIKKWQLITSSFSGGIALSLMELYQMFNNKEPADLFFFGGMLIAGLIGIIGYVLASAENTRSAFLAGVSAPQLLGGIVKAGSKGIQTISLILCTSVYAQPNDSTYVIVNLNGVNKSEIYFNDTLFIADSQNNKLRVKYQDSIIVKAGSESKVISLNKDTTFISIKSETTQVQTKTSRLFRGIIAQKVFEREKNNIIKKDPKYDK